MKFLENNKTAVISLVIMVLIAFLVGAPLSLTKDFNKIENLFFGESNAYTFIEKRAGYARDVVQIASSGTSIDPNDEKVVALNDALAVISRKSDISTISTANSTMEESVNYIALIAKNDPSLSSTELKNLDNAQANFKSQNDKLSHSSIYNEKAERFNHSLNSFPTNILANVVGVNELEIFQ
ncbi:MAG: LemA family protein [Oscillospiraceae bacterium]